jgi:hypothetical protein
VHAYARGVTPLGDLGGRAALLLALAFLGLVPASPSSAQHPVVDSSPADGVAIESVPTLLVTVSDRPVLSQHMRLAEGQRALWLMTVSAPTVGVPASVLGSVRSSPSVLSAGLVAQGLTGRGPPSSTNG